MDIFTSFCCKKCNNYWLKRPKICGKEPRNCSSQKYGPKPASFCLFSPLSQNNDNNGTKFNYKQKKHGWWAWATNPEPQNGRYKRIHRAMAAPTKIKFDFTGRDPSLVVMGGDSCSEGRGFESRRHILDGHNIFSHKKSSLPICKGYFWTWILTFVSWFWRPNWANKIRNIFLLFFFPPFSRSSRWIFLHVSDRPRWYIYR